ncbi:MAG: heparinase II/III family protein [bacterium]|nr:heparinase II/III family protein [bacterium]
MKSPLACLVALSAMGMGLFAEVSPEDLVARARQAPALLFTREQLPAIKDRITADGDAQAWWEGFRKEVDHSLAKNLMVPEDVAQWYHWYSCRKCGAHLKGKSPKEHVCPKCGELHTGWPYDQSYNFDVHHACGKMIRNAALVGLLSGEARYRQVAKDFLLEYAKRYRGYPRHDNNGPNERNRDAGHVFSQILDESVWLINIVQGYDLIREFLTEEERETICEGLLRPAADIIYIRDDYGKHILGNHQCWHLSAYALASLLLGDVARVNEARKGLSGWEYQLQTGILSDGCWYEGAWGYHFYTMSSLMPYFTALRNLGEEPPEIFRRMFDPPFGQMTPDGHLPAVNDSGRPTFVPGSYAELYERAWTWWKDPRFGWWVSQKPRRTMDYALWGAPVPKGLEFPSPTSRNFEASGFAVLRSRSARTKGAIPGNYVALDYGPHGGWHGHYDKLNLLVWAQGEMFAEDPGCIGYGNPLHWGWYRASLAHNTLVVDGKSQKESTGRLLSFGETNGVSHIVAEAGDIVPGVRAVRATALVGDVLLDLVWGESKEQHLWEWAFHARGALKTSVEQRDVPTMRPKIESKTRRDIERQAAASDAWQWTTQCREGAHGGEWRATWQQKKGRLALIQRSSAGTLRTAVGCAQPPPATFRVTANRVQGTSAQFATAMALDGATEVEFVDEEIPAGFRGFSVRVKGSLHRFRISEDGKRVSVDVIREPTGCPEFTVERPRMKAGPVLQAGDFGFSTSTSNNAAALTAVLREAKRVGARRVELASGTYYCHDARGVVAEGLEDVEIDGKGATLVFYRPSDFYDQPQWMNEHAGANVLLKSCRRVRLVNLDVDWDWERDPLGGFVRVCGVNPSERGTFDSSLDLEFVDYARHPHFGKPLPVQTLYAADESRDRMRVGDNNYFGQSEGHFGCRMKWLSPNRIRIWPGVKSDCGPYSTQYEDRLKAENNYWTVKRRKVGDFLRLSHYYYGKNCFVVENGEQIVFNGVNILSCRGMGWAFDGTVHHVEVKGCNVLPPHRLGKVAKGPVKRPFTTTADVVHVSHGSQGYFKFEDYQAAMNQDDLYNFHDRSSWAAKTGPRELMITQKRGIRYFNPSVGDELELLGKDYSTTGFRAKIERIDGERMLMDREVPDRFREGGIVFDRARNTSHILIRNCVHEGPTGRCCILAPDVTIDGLVIRHSQGQALKIQSGTTTDKWSEGYGATNVVVRNCVFEDVNMRGAAMYGVKSDVFIGVNYENGRDTGVHPVESLVSGILLENNAFIQPRAQVLYIHGASDVFERGNRTILTK